MAVIDNIYNYFERTPELRVLFVFDPMGDIEMELFDAVWPNGYRYEVFDGKWFTTKYAIENLWTNEKVVLLFKGMQSPEKSAEISEFPLMDILVANMEFKNSDYEAFMQMHALQPALTTFVKKHIAELQLKKFSEVLTPYYADEGFNLDMANRGLLSVYLGENKMLEWTDIIISFILLDIADEKKKNSTYAALAKAKDVDDILQAKLKSIFGTSYLANVPMRMKRVAESLLYNAITQLLNVVETDSYKALKVTNSVSIDFINKLLERVNALHPQRKKNFLKAMHTLAADIQISNIVAWYGVKAPYFYIPEELGWQMINVVVNEQVKSDPSEAIERLRELLLKNMGNDVVTIAITYAMKVAAFYEKKNTIGNYTWDTPNEYVAKYKSELYLLDRYYRNSLEYYHQLEVEIPVIQSLDDLKIQLDEDYATITNLINIEWTKCLKERGNGFAELSAMKQQDFYNTYASNSGVKQVVIISDALRYEVATELFEQLGTTHHIAEMNVAIAMLPTETKFCKPALFPHRDLSIYSSNNEVVLGVDSTNLEGTDKKSSHLQKYVSEAVCMNFDEVINYTLEQKRTLFKKPLVYILHNDIDRLGHDGGPMSMERACAEAIKDLAKFIYTLHSSCAVSNITITADHGFLYNDKKFTEVDKHTITDSYVERKTRYYLTESDVPVHGILKFPMENVSGMQGGLMVAVPTGTNRMAAQGGGYNFAHGGASLQEVIIPVITSKAKRTQTKQKVTVSLVGRNLAFVSSRLRVRLLQDDPVSMELLERTIVGAVYYNDKPVTAEKEITLNSKDADSLNNRMYEMEFTLQETVTAGVMKLKIFDIDDTSRLNPLITEIVTNKTLIDQDF